MKLEEHIRWRISVILAFALLNFLTECEACSCRYCCGWGFHGLGIKYCSDHCYRSWNGWGEYSACSATCGGGTQSRTRTCPCGGSESESRFCGESCFNGVSYSGGRCPCQDWHYGSCCNRKITTMLT